MKAGPTITKKEFARRRADLMSMMAANSIAVVPSARIVARNRDVDYPFRQNSDFHYLCGFGEADAVLVLVPGRVHGETLLFCRERDPDLERWHGQITGPERAMQRYGLDDAFTITDIDDILPGLIEGAHAGVGLGHEFLRHVERAGILVHVVEPAPMDGSDPLANYRTIREELTRYDASLGTRPEVLVVSKSELPEAEEVRQALARETGRDVLAISAATGAGLEQLLRKVSRELDQRGTSS